MRLPPRTLLIFVVLLPVTLWGQASAAPAQHGASKNDAKGLPKLTVVRTVRAESEVATSFVPPLRCDSEGNLYLMNDPYGVNGIRKLNAKGERLALFTSSIRQDMKLDLAGSFALGVGGTIYQLVFPHEITRYLFVYGSDGVYKSKIKLEPGFAWQPSTLGVFSSGNLLVAGQKYDGNNSDGPLLPATALFSPDGKLLKEIKLEDDQAIYEMGARGDSRVTLPQAPTHNLAFSSSQIEPGKDGNLYLMRRLTPAILYAVSSSGEVVRRFTVDPGDASLEPWEMHVSGDRIAIVFHHPQTWDSVLKIVDLEGQPIKSYAASTEYGKDGTRRPESLAGPLACYNSNPERFTFLSNGDDSKLELSIVEPR
jgi:hypothetical protein